MPSWLDDPEKWKRRNTAPPDPVLLGARGERPINYNSATGRVLYHQNHMPLGPHAGKIMERVPAAYLLQVLHDYRTEPPAGSEVESDAREQRRKDWFPVISYIQRHHAEINQRAARESQQPTANSQQPSSRTYELIIRTTLVTAEAASKTTDPRNRCELCHDDPIPCDCNPDTRTKRVLARLKK